MVSSKKRAKIQVGKASERSSKCHWERDLSSGFKSKAVTQHADASLGSGVTSGMGFTAGVDRPITSHGSAPSLSTSDPKIT